MKGKGMVGYSVKTNLNNEKIAHIQGGKGNYDGKIKNDDVRYGRNAINNFKQYASTRLEKTDFPDLSNLSSLSEDEFSKKLQELDSSLQKADIALSKLPPLNFVLKYMPKGKLNKMALLGASFEEMGKTKAIITDDLTQSLKKSITSDTDLNADVIDINKDGKIDIAEYSTTLLLSDMMSTDDSEINPANIDGKITEKGQLSLLAFVNRKNKNLAQEIFGKIYNMFNLKEAQDKFLADKNNLI